MGEKRLIQAFSDSNKRARVTPHSHLPRTGRSFEDLESELNGENITDAAQDDLFMRDDELLDLVTSSQRGYSDDDWEASNYGEDDAAQEELLRAAVSRLKEDTAQLQAIQREKYNRMHDSAQPLFTDFNGRLPETIFDTDPAAQSKRIQQAQAPALGTRSISAEANFVINRLQRKSKDGAAAVEESNVAPAHAPSSDATLGPRNARQFAPAALSTLRDPSDLSIQADGDDGAAFADSLYDDSIKPESTRVSRVPSFTQRDSRRSQGGGQEPDLGSYGDGLLEECVCASCTRMT